MLKKSPASVLICFTISNHMVALQVHQIKILSDHMVPTLKPVKEGGEQGREE